MTLIGGAFAALGFMIFAYRRLRRYLHIFQQEEYDGRRFLVWLMRKPAFDRRLSLVIAAGACFVWLAATPVPDFIWQGGFALLFAGLAFLEPDPGGAEAKKKLAMTSRARRIFWLAVGLITVSAVLAGLFAPPLGWLLPVQAIPLLLVLANLLLMPYEAHVQRGYWKEAHSRVMRLKPTIIGITGSFGKTSVKHILGHILELNARTLYTPGSVNTAMGIARIIREQLRPGVYYFVVEMGAYRVGSIDRLCRLTPPDLGIITAIGEAHYERFRTLDAVGRAKFELAEWVLKKQGRMVVGDGVLREPYARDFIMQHRERFLVCGGAPESDLVIETIEQMGDGLVTRVTWDGKDYTLRAPLYGLHHGANMALAFGAAVLAGVPADKAIAAMASAPQIRHRLEVRPQDDGSILIDDAYNSNPTGFSSALALTDALRTAKGRRILITPGMAELGARHDEAHAELGRQAAELVDIALVVRAERIPSFVHAYERGSNGARLIRVNSFSEAQAWLVRNVKRNDVVLIENDLPDLYEAPFRV